MRTGDCRCLGCSTQGTARSIKAELITSLSNYTLFQCNKSLGSLFLARLHVFNNNVLPVFARNEMITSKVCRVAVCKLAMLFIQNRTRSNNTALQNTIKERHT